MAIASVVQVHDRAGSMKSDANSDNNTVTLYMKHSSSTYDDSAEIHVSKANLTVAGGSGCFDLGVQVLVPRSSDPVRTQLFHVSSQGWAHNQYPYLGSSGGTGTDLEIRFRRVLPKLYVGTVGR